MSKGIENISYVKEGTEAPEKHDVAATTFLQQRINDIRSQKVNWQSYCQSQMISQEDYNFISNFDNSDSAAREKIIQTQRQQCAKTFLNLLGHISKDQTIQYILILIDDLFEENKSHVEIFKEHSRKKKENVWNPFVNLLNRPDNLIVNLTACVIAKMACWGKELMDGNDLRFYLTWLKDHLRLQSNDYIQAVARCLQLMLRIDEYRSAFVEVDGIKTLVNVLTTATNFQIQYQLIFCLWVLTFNVKLAEQLSKANAIPILADLQRDNPKEKVVRIILAVYRNLIEKPQDPLISRENSIAMVQSKVLKYLELMEQHKYEDEDLTADMEFLSAKLRASVQDLSSFDEYATELKSGRLEWSPVHKSAKFWQENVMRLHEKNYELLKILVHLVQNSKDPLVLSVASYDIGEYVRHYPRGKRVIEQLDGKTHVMHLLVNDDPNVRYEALVAVQKMMVHNWEYLGKQLEKSDVSPTQTSKQGMGLTGKA